MMDSPKNIYLQYNPAAEYADDATWCSHKINETDITYVRADIHAADAEDAALYRFIRRQKENLQYLFSGSGSMGFFDVCDGLSNEELDDSIRAAIAARESSHGK